MERSRLRLVWRKGRLSHFLCEEADSDVLCVVEKAWKVSRP